MNGAAAFDRYVGIDYSGAQTPVSSLKGLRVFMAASGAVPSEVHPPPSHASIGRGGASPNGWPISCSPRSRLSLGSTTVSRFRSSTSSSTECRSIGPPSWRTSTGTGPRRSTRCT